MSYPLTKPRVRCHPNAPRGQHFSVEFPGEFQRRYAWSWQTAMDMALGWWRWQS